MVFVGVFVPLEVDVPVTEGLEVWVGVNGAVGVPVGGIIVLVVVAVEVGVAVLVRLGKKV